MLRIKYTAPYNLETSHGALTIVGQAEGTRERLDIKYGRSSTNLRTYGTVSVHYQRKADSTFYIDSHP